MMAICIGYLLIYFIAVSRLGAVPLVHINIIRDPVSRFVSQFYFKRFGDGRDRDRSSIFHGKIHQVGSSDSVS